MKKKESHISATPPTPHSESPPSPAVERPSAEVMKEMKDSMGRYRVQSLFEGKGRGEGDEADRPLYTLEEYDKPGLPSFKKLYVDIGDPSEYLVAMRMLGSWEHWRRLTDSPWFRPYLQEARDELNAKIRSQAITKITVDAEGAFSEATRLAANKFLATGGYLVETEKEVVKENAKRGRPSKEEIARRTKEILTEEGTIKADLERMTSAPKETRTVN